VFGFAPPRHKGHAAVEALDAMRAGRARALVCLGRTELDVQATGPQSVTVKDSMSMVHASRGRLPPASAELNPEPAIVAGLARSTLPDSQIDWEGYVRTMAASATTSRPCSWISGTTTRA
jgi:hypothetical protein